MCTNKIDEMQIYTMKGILAKKSSQKTILLPKINPISNH